MVNISWVTMDILCVIMLLSVKNRLSLSNVNSE
jgi:hypothetical protein